MDNDLNMEPYYQDDSCIIYHGDASEVLQTLPTVALVATDPPYGINYQSNMRTATPQFDRIANDTAVGTDWIGYLNVKDGGAIYLATRWDVAAPWLEALKQHGYTPKNCVIWYKRGGGMGDLEGSWSPEHEQILFAHKGRHSIRGKRTGDVWMVDKDPPSSYQHPTTKPVTLMARIIAGSSDAGDLVLDPFMGSGTTLRAAKDLNRKAIGIELEERYCEIAAKRLAAASDMAARVSEAQESMDL